MTSEPTTPIELLDHIGRELKLLWAQMDAYQELFEVEQAKRAPLLANSAPGCFKVLQLSLIDSMLMRIFRLIDPAKTGRFENSSFGALREAFRSESAQVACPLLEKLDSLLSEWAGSGATRYAGLKYLRDKNLSHNDRTSQVDRDDGQLWMTLTPAEFNQAQALASEMWGIYCAATRQLRGVSVLEPQYEHLADRPAMLMKRLSEAMYLDHLLGQWLKQEQYQQVTDIESWHNAHVGEDRIRQVFTPRCGTAQ